MLWEQASNIALKLQEQLLVIEADQHLEVGREHNFCDFFVLSKDYVAVVELDRF